MDAHNQKLAKMKRAERRLREDKKRRSWARMRALEEEIVRRSAKLRRELSVMEDMFSSESSDEFVQEMRSHLNAIYTPCTLREFPSSQLAAAHASLRTAKQEVTSEESPEDSRPNLSVKREPTAVNKVAPGVGQPNLERSLQITSPRSNEDRRVPARRNAPKKRLTSAAKEYKDPKSYRTGRLEVRPLLDNPPSGKRAAYKKALNSIRLMAKAEIHLERCDSTDLDSSVLADQKPPVTNNPGDGAPPSSPARQLEAPVPTTPPPPKEELEDKPTEEDLQFHKLNAVLPRKSRSSTTTGQTSN